MAYSHHSTLGYVRRGTVLLLALFFVVVAFFVAFQWKTYRRNLTVSDANLSPLPALQSDDRILILSPHPDDETLGAGGLMAKARRLGIPVRVVFMTNGDGSLATRLVQDAQFVEKLARRQDAKRPQNIYRQIALMRQKEALAALQKLNIPAADVVFLGYPDGGTKPMWETNWKSDNPFRSAYTKTDHSPYSNSWTAKAPYCGEQLLEDLQQVIIGYKPTIVITTNSYDTHPDHWAANAYLNAALLQLRQQQKYFSWTQKIRNYTFIVHHGLWPVPHGYHPDAELSPPAALTQIGIPWLQLSLNKEEESTKADALQQYKSQLATTPQFLRGFLRRNELFAQSENKNDDFHNWQSIIHDPRSDLLLPQLVPAADITTVSLKKENGKVLLIRIGLDGKPWNDITYQLTLHQVSAHGVSLNRIILSSDNKHQWKGTIVNRNTSNGIVNVTKGTSQLTVRIPINTLAQRMNESPTILLSASSSLRKRTLDQTPTKIARVSFGASD